MIDLVYLVRHGRSLWNAAGLTQGTTRHPPLVAEGREQIEATCAVLRAEFPPRSVVNVTSSDLVRAVESADLLAAGLGASRSVDLRLRERGFGLFQGTRHARTTRWQGRASSVALAHAGVESPENVTRRGREFLEGLPSGTRHVVVAHGELLRWLPGGQQLGLVDNGAVLIWDGNQIRRL